ncbi:(2Fe-2S)-binding protein [Oceaniglobus roseus]|uniref:(2Fe-2S)-binding protein n=1 Tax=Oceaniglobus roseus TaxID=1737570 RepID=UPI000C7EC14E|nr:(2Fe-2S)-binding protein [Kandeliimicrobium roseum]
MALTLSINGEPREIEADPETPLAYVLRNELGLKGTKIGCGLEQCGACMILADGAPFPSCAAPAASFAGKEITTIEGIASRPAGARVQAAFIAETAAQCGYCTAGLVVACTALLEANPSPTEDEAKSALAPNLCRCGAHPRVLRALARAAT